MLKYNSGYTLVELLVGLAIAGILASFAIPSYLDSLENSCLSAAKINMLSLTASEQNYYLEHEVFIAGERLVDGSGNVTSDTLSTPLRWTPNDLNELNYKVTTSSGTFSIEVSRPNCNDKANESAIGP